MQAIASMTSAISQQQRKERMQTVLRAETDLIRQHALSRLEELCSYLLPNGRKEGCRWLAGSVAGEPGRSFDVNLRTGVFGDWAAQGKMKQGGINLWMEVRQVDFLTAKRELAEWLSIPTEPPGSDNHRSIRVKPREPKQVQPIKSQRQIQLPELETPTFKDLRQLSESRSIDVAALRIASDRGFFWCFDDNLNGRCWLITDERRKCAIRRRLDNQPFKLASGATTKAAACSGSDMTTPLGYKEAINYPCVAVVEGGPDALSAFTYARDYGVEERVAVVCMPCTAARFTASSLLFLKNKRVRIFVHNNEPGNKAAEAWSTQLKVAPISVDGFSFDGLVQSDGAPVADLNDLLRIDPDCWGRNQERVDSIMNFASSP
jgi:hypothetical protein